MKFYIHKKEREGLLYENSEGKNIVRHSKLKLWTFFWGHGEREWPLVFCYNIIYNLAAILAFVWEQGVLN